MLKAAVSGRAAAALVIEGANWYRIDAERIEVQRPSGPHEWCYVFGFSDDIQYQTFKSYNEVRKALSTAVDSDHALILSLICLDNDTKPETRKLAGADLKEILSRTPSAFDFVWRVLAAKPLPEKASIEKAYSVTQVEAHRLFERIDAHRSAIEIVRAAWRAIPRELFQQMDADEVFAVAARNGICAAYVEALHEQRKPHLPAFNLPEDWAAGAFQRVLAKWGELIEKRVPQRIPVQEVSASVPAPALAQERPALFAAAFGVNTRVRRAQAIAWAAVVSVVMVLWTNPSFGWPGRLSLDELRVNRVLHRAPGYGVQSSDLLPILLSIFGFTSSPLLLTALAAFLGRLYRRVMWPAVPPRPRRQRSEQNGETAQLPVIGAEKVASPPPGSMAADARNDAFGVNARVQRAHVIAWLVYATVVSSFIVLLTIPTFGWPARLALGYGALAPQILILLWAIRLPVRWRLLIFLVYAVAGVVLLLSFTNAQRTTVIVWSVIKIFVLIPIPGLLFLFIRRNQPFLVLLIAAAVYFMESGLILDRYATTIATKETVLETPWLILLGLANVTLGAAGAWLLLRQRRWSIRALAILAGVIGAVLLDRDIVQQNLPLAVRYICFLAVAILQVLILWLLIKCFVWLAERRFLTLELVQVHLCWTFLTFYLVATTLIAADFYQDKTIARWAFVLALCLFIITLHLLLIRLYRRRRPVAEKRLLLLRVFGRPNEREDLLDDLNDTWRRIGAVDLLAASDVASRTLESRMLEAFLLRRSSDQFLRTEAAVHARIEQRRSTIEGDARYPVDPFFCHESVWWPAFTGLAGTADVVMMDVRGFSPMNERCVRELTYLLQHPLQKVVLIGDSRSDLQALDEMARAAGVAANLTVLDFSKRSKEEQRTLFELLLNAAYA